MATTNFYLKNPNDKEDTLIYLFFRYSGQLLKFSTGETINPKNWNFENQSVKKSFTGSPELNGYLDKVREEVLKIYRNTNTNGIKLTSDNIREELIKRLNKKPENQRKFFDYFDEYIEINLPTKRLNTINKYKTLAKHLKNFEQHKKFKISFEKLDMIFYEILIAYFINDLKLLNNTYGKYITTFKTFLHWATNRGYNTNRAFVKFKAPKEDADIIYLTETELMNLYEMDLSNNKRLENTRDVFCFGCFTGLRFSDISRLKKENVKGEQLNFVTQKTKDNLTVPLNDYAKEILEKHDYRLPVISNQNTNLYLKELGKIAGIDEPIILTKYRGAEEIQFKEPKYNFMSSHTARRTFVTLSLEKGMRAETVMANTGHKDYKTLKKYIKITNKVKLVEMKQVWNREPKLKAI